jgi:hypothetical protein
MAPARFSGEVISVIEADNTGMLPTNRPATARKKIALHDRPYFGQSEKLNALAYERNNHDWFAAKAVTYASPKNAGEHCGPNRDRKRARRAKGARAVCRGEALKSRSRV